MGGRGSWSETYKNEMSLDYDSWDLSDNYKQLNSKYNPGGRFKTPEGTARHVEEMIVGNNYETAVVIDAENGDVLAAY